MGRLTADFAKAFSRDLKKNAKRRNWNLTELEKSHRSGSGEHPGNAGGAAPPPQHAHPVRQLARAIRMPCRQCRGLASDLVIERFSRILRTHRQPRRIIPLNRR